MESRGYSVAVYNRMLERQPDLAQALCEDLYRTRSGEMNPGEVAAGDRQVARSFRATGQSQRIIFVEHRPRIDRAIA